MVDHGEDESLLIDDPGGDDRPDSDRPGSDTGGSRRIVSSVALAVCLLGGILLVLTSPTDDRRPDDPGPFPVWHDYRQDASNSAVAVCLLTWSLNVDLLSGAGRPLLSADGNLGRFAVWREDAVRWSGGLGPGLRLLDRLGAGARPFGDSPPYGPATVVALEALAEVDGSTRSAVQIDVGPAVVAARSAYAQVAPGPEDCPLAADAPENALSEALRTMRRGTADGPIRVTRCVEGEVVALLADGSTAERSLVGAALALLASRRAEDPTDGGAVGVIDDELAGLIESIGAGPAAPDFARTWDDHRHRRGDLLVDCPIAVAR